MKAYLHRRILWLWILTTAFTIFILCAMFIKVGETKFEFFGKESDYKDKAVLWDYLVSRFPKLGNSKKWQLVIVTFFCYIATILIDFFAISPFFWRFTTEGKNWNIKTKLEREKLLMEYKKTQEQKRSLKQAQNRIYKQNKKDILEHEKEVK